MRASSNIINDSKLYKLFAIGLFSFLLSYTVASTFAPVANSSATDISNSKTQNLSVNVTNPYYINITSSRATAGEPISLDYGADGNTIGNVIATSDTVTTETNSPLTHYLYLSTASNSNNLSSSDEHNSDIISAGGGDNLTSASALGDNTWGFALPSGTSGIPTNTFDADYSSVSSSSKFTKVPTSGNEVLIQQETGSGIKKDMSVSTSTANVYYGTKATTDIPAGTYSNIIRYTAYAEEPDNSPRLVENITYLQEMTDTICQDMPEADTLGNDIYTLKDKRDEKGYKIAHLADGNCWMVQNLALDGTDANGNVRTLTPADSNVTSNHALAANDNTGNWDGVYDVIKIYSGGATDTDSNGNRYGNLYNWHTATATSGSTTTPTWSVVYESICAKGWRLPTSDLTTDDKTYKGLTDAHSIDTSNYMQYISSAPLSFPEAGQYNSTLNERGTYGSYWTRRANGAKGAQVLAFSSTRDKHFAPAGSSSGSQMRGYSVRCVFGS